MTLGRTERNMDVDYGLLWSEELLGIEVSILERIGVDVSTNILLLNHVVPAYTIKEVMGITSDLLGGGAQVQNDGPATRHEQIVERSPASISVVVALLIDQPRNPFSELDLVPSHLGIRFVQ